MSDRNKGMSDQDRVGTLAKYKKGFKEHGYSPKSLGWDKGRQDIRFEVILSFFNCRGKSVLDIGCGFGDLNRILASKTDEYQYTGIDLVEDLIGEGRRQYPQKNVTFLNADFLEYPFKDKFDIVVASGIFNHKFSSGENDLFVERVLHKAWSLCNDGICFDFLSDKVEFRHDHTYHNNPERILGLGYGLSRNVVLRNDYMPFEFSLYIGKDDSFDQADAVFKTLKKRIAKL